MNAQQVLTSMKEKLGSACSDDRVIERMVGVLDPKPVYDAWLTIEPAAFHDAVAFLCEAYDPHISVISGEDIGDSVALNYHFTVGWGERFGEITLSLRTVLPKSELKIPTITDVLPGAQTAEREKIEFYGIEVVGIPDDRNIFLPEDATIHPWRKDLEEETQKEVVRRVKWEARNEE